jgi:hypothetical protein
MAIAAWKAQIDLYAPNADSHLRRGRSRSEGVLLLTKTRLISFDKPDNLLVYSRSATSIYANAGFLAATGSVESEKLRRATWASA